jgi:hypothetical protein
VRSVLGLGEQRLRVPYWALPAADIVRIFAGAPGGATLNSRFAELVTEARRNFVASAQWLHLNPTAVTSDTPVPFDMRPIWHKLDWENHETRMVKADANTHCQTNAGDAATLQPAQFQPYNPGGQAPHQVRNTAYTELLPIFFAWGCLTHNWRFFKSRQEPRKALTRWWELYRNGLVVSGPFLYLTSVECHPCRLTLQSGSYSTFYSKCRSGAKKAVPELAVPARYSWLLKRPTATWGKVQER